MRITVPARRYAKALAGRVRDAALLEKTAAEMDAFRRLLEAQEALRTVLFNPGVTPAARREIVKRLSGPLGLSPHLTSFLCLLIGKGRLAVFPQIVEAFREIADARAGRVRTEIRTARPLSKEEAARVQKALEKTLGKTIIMTVEEDARLLGGLVARIGSEVYDFSLRTQLERLKESIAKGGM